jgi:tetratricopeptide (TPR) repeat protein
MTAARGESRPFRVGVGDLAALEAATRAFRALDYRFGGGFCRAPLAALGSWTVVLRKGTVPPRLRRRLCRALADLHNLLAWTEFDSGRYESALRSFDVAAELAEEAGDHDLLANIRYRRGRLHLHRRAVDDALAEFEQGRLSARRGPYARTQAILSANQAWAWAMRADESAALRHLGQAADAFAAGSEAAPWARFFDANDLSAMTGTVRVELAYTVDRQHAVRAIPFLDDAVAAYGPEMGRSRSLTQIMLALGHALRRDTEEAARVGAEAIGAAREIRSVRAEGRLRPLETVLRDGPNSRDSRELLTRIAEFRAESRAGPEG